MSTDAEPAVDVDVEIKQHLDAVILLKKQEREYRSALNTNQAQQESVADVLRDKLERDPEPGWANHRTKKYVYGGRVWYMSLLNGTWQLFDYDISTLDVKVL
jgi:hypothetical protein